MQRLRMTGAALVLGAVALVPTPARAAPIQIKGDATACFGLNCSNFEDTAATTIGGVTLSFDSNADWDFSGTTVDDVLAIEGGNGNFGTLSVNTPGVDTRVSSAFALLLTFLNPDSPTATFQAAIRGTVSSNENGGGVLVRFNPDMVEGLTFYDEGTGQSGTMNVILTNNVSIASGGDANLTGFIETQVSGPTSVPEPGSLLLLGTGVLALMFGRRVRMPTA
jgi:hypothetical protein